MRVLTKALTPRIAAIGPDPALGYGGMIGFGHAAYVGVGAYAVWILATHGTGEDLLVLPAAIVAAGLAGLAISALSRPSERLTARQYGDRLTIREQRAFEIPIRRRTLMTEVVSFALRDGIATMTMDDGKANALSLAMSQALDAGLDRAAKEAKVIVIRGRPGVLCGGFDLKVIRGNDPAQSAAMREAGMQLMTRLYLLPQPVIFACTGHSVAAGGLLLLTGDIRIGLRGEFRIGLNEVGIGLALPQTGIELARDG